MRTCRIPIRQCEFAFSIATTLFFTQVVSFKASPLLAALAGVLGGLSSPAAPIIIPIAATVVLGWWAHNVYQQSCVLRFLRMR